MANSTETFMVPLPIDRVDPRCTRSQQRVLAAAVSVLREEGLPGLTFEAVAARSGVAKTTIYRHFHNRDGLHLAAIESVGPSLAMRSTDDLVADVVMFLDGLNHTLHHSDFGAILLTALDAAERHEAMAALALTAAQQRRAQLVRRLKVAQKSGALAADADLDLACSQLVGPLFYRRCMSRQATSSAFVANLASNVLTPLLRP
jgi:AcrR family transcriptional regulator